MSSTDYLRIIKNADEDFQVYMIMLFVGILVVIYILYGVYMLKLNSRECDYMNNLYSSVDGNIQAIHSGGVDSSGNLFDYYIKTAYNACSGGTYKNDYVNICNLKAIIKQGVRCFDFEIYSIDNQPVVATSTTDNYYVKETFNSVQFSEVMTVLRNYALSTSTSPSPTAMCPNPTDPLLIHLRFKSNNQSMYSNLSNIFKANTDVMLGPTYSYESEGKNLGNVPILELCNKIILVVDRSNTAFLENESLLEYVNMTSNSIFMREYDYYNVKNNPDINELTEFNKTGMTIVLPDSGANPANPNGLVCRASGCQMVAMRYQLIDNYLMENTLFYDREQRAFALKPLELRYQPVTVPTPTRQNPEYSYKTRVSSTDYYSFQF